MSHWSIDIKFSFNNVKQGVLDCQLQQKSRVYGKWANEWLWGMICMHAWSACVPNVTKGKAYLLIQLVVVVQGIVDHVDTHV
jgi:hypothetical protein